MESAEISRHEVAVYLALKGHADAWMTNKDIAVITDGVALRTVRAHTMKLVQLGLLDQAEVFPAHRYRWSSMGEKRNPAYVLRLKQATDVFGL